ncbi:MAG: TetR/AcrR family transcriptional regulator [Rhizobiaceae bacterium]
MSKTDTRTQILDAAADLFWSKSYHGVNMNELSRFAEVNKATVYQYFRSKEELAIASIKRTAEQTEEYLYRSTFAEADDPKSRIINIYEKAYQLHLDVFRRDGNCRGCPFVNLGVELAVSHPPMREAVTKALDNYRKYYGEIIDDRWKTSQQPEGFDRDEIILSLLTNMNSCLVASKLQNRPEAILDGRKQALRILAM